MRQDPGGVESGSKDAAPKPGKHGSNAAKDIVTSSVVPSSAQDPPPPDTTVAVRSQSEPDLNEPSADKEEKTVSLRPSRIRSGRHKSDTSKEASTSLSRKGRKHSRLAKDRGSRETIPNTTLTDVPQDAPPVIHLSQGPKQEQEAQETSSAPLQRLDGDDHSEEKAQEPSAAEPLQHPANVTPLDQNLSCNLSSLGHRAADSVPNVLTGVPCAATPSTPGSSSAAAITPIAPTIAAVDTEVARAKDTRCGCFGHYEPFLQRYRTMRWMLLFFCLTSFTRGFSMSGVLLVVLPTLERRYSLSGSESGTIVSANDMASCLIMLPVSFLSSNRHKPRIVGFGLILVGVGNFVISLAHFLAPSYGIKGGANENCPRMDSGSDSCSAEGIRKFRFVMIAGQILAGVGATPINTVSIAYLDENLPPAKSAAYIGIFNSMGVLGPSVGFMFGGMSLRYFVDIAADIKAQRLTPKSGAWIGAWWIGFVLSTAMGLVLGAGTSMFPKHLPEYYQYKEERKQVHDLTTLTVTGLQSHDFGARLTDLPKAVLKLCKNKPLMFLCLGSSFSQMFSIGITSIVAKFFEAQFSLSPTKVSLILGPVVLVGGAGGTIAGGLLVAKLKLGNAGILRMCVCNCILSILGVLAFWLHCPDPDLAINDTGDPKMASFEFPCNSHCHCNEEVIDPVCTADNVMYMSPCYAGCRISIESGTVQAYTSCSCVNGSMPLPGKPSGGHVEAVRSKCPLSCGLLAIYVLAVCVCVSTVFLNLAPSTAATIRVVKPAERSLALGVKVIISRILGSIPAPIIFGTIVDGSCHAWHRRCGEIGNCLSYTNRRMAHGIFFTLVVCMAACMLSYATALYFLNRRSRKGSLKMNPREDSAGISKEAIQEDEAHQDDTPCDSPLRK